MKYFKILLLASSIVLLTACEAASSTKDTTNPFVVTENNSASTDAATVTMTESSVNLTTDQNKSIVSLSSNLVGSIEVIHDGHRITVTKVISPDEFSPRLTGMLLSELTKIGKTYSIEYDVTLISGNVNMNYIAISDDLGRRNYPLTTGHYIEDQKITSTGEHNDEVRYYLSSTEPFVIEITNIQISKK